MSHRLVAVAVALWCAWSSPLSTASAVFWASAGSRLASAGSRLASLRYARCSRRR